MCGEVIQPSSLHGSVRANPLHRHIILCFQGGNKPRNAQNLPAAELVCGAETKAGIDELNEVETLHTRASSTVHNGSALH